MRMKIGKTALILTAVMGLSLLAGCDNEKQQIFKEAEKDLEQGSYEYALDEFTTSVNNGVKPAVSYRGIGICQLRLGNYDDAISDLEKIQKMDDSYSDGGVYKLLGDAYAGKGDKDNAKSNYEKAATDYPGTQAAYSAQSALDAMGSDGTSENTSGGTGTQGQ